MDREWVDFAVDVADLDEIGAPTALRKNFLYAAGALGLDRRRSHRNRQLDTGRAVPGADDQTAQLPDLARL